MNDSTGREVYVIPDNFMDGGRSIQGMVRTRYLVEGCILGGIGFLLGAILPISNFTTHLMVDAFLATPLLFLGVVGINDSPLSVALFEMVKWHKNRQLYFFDKHPRPLSERPAENYDNQPTARDKLIEQYLSHRATKSGVDTSAMLQGVDYQFRDTTGKKTLNKKEKKKNKKEQGKELHQNTEPIEVRSDDSNL